MKIDIKLDTRDNYLIFDLFGKKYANRSDKVIIDKNVELEYRGIIMKFADGSPQTIHLVLDIETNDSSELVSSWLYDKIKDKAVKLRINRNEISITKDEIKKTIEEIIKENKVWT